MTNPIPFSVLPSLKGVTMFKTLFLVAFCAFFVTAENTGKLTGTIETGFLAVLDHKIQLSNNGTYFDYDEEGGQDVLFSVSRFSLDWHLSSNHTIVLLYQPLALETREVLRRDVRIDNMLYPSGSGLICRYYFPFYRISWLRDLSPEPEKETAIGLSLQIRNATIEFESTDGTRLRVQHNIGPVPILKFRLHRPLGNSFFWGAEADGFYAPISYLNGSDTEVTGAILDANGRLGMLLSSRNRAFLNLRYLGGGAVGTSRESRELGDGYVKNWLHFMTVTACFSHDF